MKGLPILLVGYVSFSLPLLVPPFFTHILPGSVMYCWIVLPVIALARGISVITGLKQGQIQIQSQGTTRRVLDFVFLGAREALMLYHIELFVEVFLRFSFIFAFHVLFNWASLVYAQGLPITPQGYIGVLVQDWHLRSQSQCFIAHAHESSRGLVTFFSWF